MRGHALGIHDVVLLLQRHLRKAGAARAGHGAEGGARGRADPCPAAATDRPADRRTERRGQDRSADRLVVGRVCRRRGLRRSILLTERLIGRERVEALVRPGRDGDRRPRWRRDARRQRNRPGHDRRYPPIDAPHVPSRSVKRQPILRRVFLCRQAASNPRWSRVHKGSFAKYPPPRAAEFKTFDDLAYARFVGRR